MKRVITILSLTLIASNLAFAQKRSDAQEAELIGPVKVVRSASLSFDLIDGKYVESSTGSEVLTQVFDREGVILFSEITWGGPICGLKAPDKSKRTYDRNGNLIEYLPNDTLEHSGFRLRHIYDSNGRRIETEYYDPYIVRDNWTYKYETFDEHGNWTGRTVTRMNAVNGWSARTLEIRSIKYY